MKKENIKFENPKKFNYSELKIGTSLLIEEAFKRKIKVSKPIDEFRILEFKGERHLINEHETDQVGRPSVRATNFKQACKDLLHISGISVPSGKLFLPDEKKKALTYFKRTKKPVVCKPNACDYGSNVFLNVDTDSKFKKAVRKITKKNHRLIVEEQFSGEEIRIFITEKGYMCSILRFPAHVVGDGVHTIKELVDIKNKDKYKIWKHRNEEIQQYMLNLEKVEKQILREQGLKPKSVPKKGAKVLLRRNSNLSTGGDSIDITDKLHPSVKEIAKKVLSAIPGLRYAGIDLITKISISEKQRPQDYRIIEVNNIPGIFGHHLPYKGKSRNPAGAILDMLFPKSK